MYVCFNTLNAPKDDTLQTDVVTQLISPSSSQEIQRLTGQLREKDLELERVRCQPDHEKDQEIQRLRSALEEKERSDATRAVLCTSLTEEADQLRSQLGATVRVCQELLARLEKEKKGGEEVEVVALEQKTKEVCDTLCWMCFCVLWASCGLVVFFFFFLGGPCSNFSSTISYR